MSDTLARLAIVQSELFHDWPDEAIARLLDCAEVLVTEPGTCVHRSGDVADYLYIVVAGSMSVTQEMPSGRSFTAGVHLPGDFHGLGPVIARKPHIFTVVCKEKTVLVRISGEILRDIIATNGRLSFSLFGALERRYTEALSLHVSAAVNSTRARIADLLRSMDARSVRGRSAAGIKLSQDEMATMLGTRRQVVNRVLREMAAEGAIKVQYGRIAIVDSDKLDKMVSDSD